VRVRPFIAMLTLATALAGAGPAFAQSDAGGSEPAPPPRTGGQEYGVENPADTPIVEGLKAKLLADGTAAAPAGAPPEVQKAVWAANEIVGRPYVYGGGHRRFRSAGYDCSGTVSYALHGGDLLDSPLDSSSFMTWGAAGPGDWITVYTNPGHAFTVIAGLRLDTSAAGDPSGAKGPRWRPVLRSTSGFKRRHPVGL
jgi:cell wall-associated NlpC family hydrolase